MTQEIIEEIGICLNTVAESHCNTLLRKSNMKRHSRVIDLLEYVKLPFFFAPHRHRAVQYEVY